MPKLDEIVQGTDEAADGNQGESTSVTQRSELSRDELGHALELVVERLEKVEAGLTQRDEAIAQLNAMIADLQEQDTIGQDDLDELASQIANVEEALDERITDVRQFAGMNGVAASAALEIARATASGQDIPEAAIDATQAIEQRVRRMAKAALVEDADASEFRERLEAAFPDAEEQQIVNQVLPEAIDQAKQDAQSESNESAGDDTDAKGDEEGDDEDGT